MKWRFAKSVRSVAISAAMAAVTASSALEAQQRTVDAPPVSAAVVEALRCISSAANWCSQPWSRSSPPHDLESRIAEPSEAQTRIAELPLKTFLAMKISFGIPVPQQGTERREGTGSGVIIKSDGLILTNNHVVQGADEVVVELSDGRSFRATDIRTDRQTDLAILRIEADEPLAPRGWVIPTRLKSVTGCSPLVIRSNSLPL